MKKEVEVAINGNYTPGPWLAYLEPCKADYQPVCMVGRDGEAGGYTWVVWQAHTQMHDGTADADAALIAAAPDLADEVRRLRAENARLRKSAAEMAHLLEAFLGSDVDPDDATVVQKTLSEYRAALAETENLSGTPEREEPNRSEREQWLRALLDDAVGLLHHHEQHKDPQWDKDYAWLTMQYDALLAELGKEIAREAGNEN